MIRNLKMLGLSLVAVCAMGAVAASAASANANYWFTMSGSDWTGLSASQVPGAFYETRFDGIVGGSPGVVKCEKSTSSGSTSATTTTTLTLSTQYSGCGLEPFGNAVINTNGCLWVIHTDPLGDTTNGEYHAVSTVECPTGNEVTVEAKIGGVTKCIIHIEPQNLGTGTVVTQNTPHLLVHINYAIVKYTQTEGTGAGRCTTTATTNNGVLNATKTLSGVGTNGQPVNLSVST